MSAHALLIGVTRFSDPLLRGLQAPKSDVEALQAVLADPARGGFDEVVPSIDEDLVTIREKLSALLDDRNPSDLVLLYYSGHGIVAKGNCLFLATSDSKYEKPRARSLPASEVREMMEQSRAGRLVVVLDCCHSGVFTDGAKGAAAAVDDRTFDPGEGAEGHYVLTATNAIQYALDSPPFNGDETAPQPALSYFTSWLVEGLLSGDAAPEKPHITLDDLYTYLCRRARQSGAPMTPQRYVKRNSGEMVIARNPAAQPPRIPGDILAKFDSSDWNVRLEALAELKEVVSRRPMLRSAARKLLRDRMNSERDRDVHDVMVGCLVEFDPGKASNEPDRRRASASQNTRWPTDAVWNLSFWENRVLAHCKLELTALSVESRADLMRSARALRNANWMLWGSLIVALLIVIAAGALGSTRPISVCIAAFVSFSAGFFGLSTRVLRADVLMKGTLSILTAVNWEFERNLFRRACWILAAAFVIAAPIAIFRGTNAARSEMFALSVTSPERAPTGGPASLAGANQTSQSTETPAPQPIGESASSDALIKSTLESSATAGAASASPVAAADAARLPQLHKTAPPEEAPPATQAAQRPGSKNASRSWNSTLMRLYDPPAGRYEFTIDGLAGSGRGARPASAVAASQNSPDAAAASSPGATHSASRVLFPWDRPQPLFHLDTQ